RLTRPAPPAIYPLSLHDALPIWALSAVGRWARGHAAGLLAATVVLGVLVVRRRELLDRLVTLAFWLSTDRDPRHRVMKALSLVRSEERRVGKECRSRWDRCS